MSDIGYVEPVPRLALGMEDAAAACGLPVSTFELECRRGKGPVLFTVGRRKFTTPELIRAWQQEKIAEATRQPQHGEAA